MNTQLTGRPPLTARLEPWMQAVIDDAALCGSLVERFGSPVNLHDFAPLARNASQLRAAAAAHSINFEVYFARKANKTIGALNSALRAGCGVDVASYHELAQTLDRGAPPARIIVSAAVKSPELLKLALENAVVVSLDNRDEVAALLEIAAEHDVRPRVALRLASSNTALPPTRFGLVAEDWLALLDDELSPDALDIVGLHFHLNGYAANNRSLVLAESMHLVDNLRDRGHAPTFVDMGGGIPMSYLDSQQQWQEFWAALDVQSVGTESITWKSDCLGATGPTPSPGVYPYYQDPVRGPWLDEVLSAQPAGTSANIAEMLRARNLTLHCEPGRSLLDGCGLTLSQVAFRKSRSDGIALLGLRMNRTQCRSTSADFLLDPILIHHKNPRRTRTPFSGFLVGAYCIEEEVILRRRFDLPLGVAPDDLIAFPNTAGYLMHIVESASHQLPLARNLVWDGEDWVGDEIDDRDLSVTARSDDDRALADPRRRTI